MSPTGRGGQEENQTNIYSMLFLSWRRAASSRQNINRTTFSSVYAGQLVIKMKPPPWLRWQGSLVSDQYQKYDWNVSWRVRLGKAEERSCFHFDSRPVIYRCIYQTFDENIPLPSPPPPLWVKKFDMKGGHVFPSQIACAEGFFLKPAIKYKVGLFNGGKRLFPFQRFVQC